MEETLQLFQSNTEPSDINAIISMHLTPLQNKFDDLTKKINANDPFTGIKDDIVSLKERIKVDEQDTGYWQRKYEEEFRRKDELKEKIKSAEGTLLKENKV